MKTAWISMLCSLLAINAAYAVCANPTRTPAGTIYLDSKIRTDSCANRYSDATEALGAVNRMAAQGAGKVTLFVAPGVYWLDDPDDQRVRKMPDNSIPYAFNIVCDTLDIVGLDSIAANTVFAVDRGQTRGAVGNYTMLHFKGASLKTSNMTFGNYCNVDLIYPADTTLNRKRRCTPIVQAQIGICENTDRLHATNCRFISRLNLCPLVGARRSLYENCYFECTDDALTGSAVYLGCRFTFFSSKPFYNTAATGAVFLNCDIDIRGKGPQYLTKIPGMVTLIDTRFTSHTTAGMVIKWTRDDTPVVSYQSGVTLNGKPYIIDSDRPFMSVDLSGKRALAAYRIASGDTIIYNTPNLLAGDDGWDPLGMAPKIKGLEQRSGRGKLTGLPVRIDPLPGDIGLKASGDIAETKAVFRRWGDYPLDNDEIRQLFPMTISYECPDALKLQPVENEWGKLKLESRNSMPVEVSGRLLIKTDIGLQGGTDLLIAPYLKKAPEFAKEPELKLSRGIISAGYSLAGVTDDRSHFEWYRCSDSGWTDSIPVRHGCGRSYASYRLTAADRGHHIGVRIIPKGSDTEYGAIRQMIFPRPIAGKDIRRADRKAETHYATDFSTVPVRFQPEISRGSWSFTSCKPADTAPYAWEADPLRCWYYGRATDAATATGLVQWTRGARAFYTPNRDGCRNMRVKLSLEPCKSAGQGFGSATGQYLDIYLKFDPETGCGYGMRVERTVDYDHAVVFTLMRYENGKALPLSQPQASTCYRTVCNVALSLTDGLLRADVSTTAAAESTPAPDITPSVSLSAHVGDATGPASFGLQHTGTTGASATLIANVELDWE